MKPTAVFKYRRGKPGVRCLDCERKWRREYSANRRLDPEMRARENEAQNNKESRTKRREYMRKRRAEMSVEEHSAEISRTAAYNKKLREERKQLEPAKLALMDNCVDVLRTMCKGGKTGKARDHVTRERIDAFEKKMRDAGWTWEERGNEPGKFNIDHVCPKMFLIGNGVDDILIINHPENLQPLEFRENIAKQDRMTLAGVEFVRAHVPYLLPHALAALRVAREDGE